MKRFLALSIPLICSVAFAQGKYRPGKYPVNQNPANYPIAVHIAATHFRPCAVIGVNTACGDGLYVEANLNGKKVELFGGVD
jgi:hypothetical protein